MENNLKITSENTNNEEQEQDVEVLEFSLINEEIDELVAKLQLLKESKEPIEFEVDDENSLLIHHDEGEGGGE